jgi:hypothetical protein
MTPASDRDAAAALAARINRALREYPADDDAARPAHDRPPAFADALMSEASASVESAVRPSLADWRLIGKALSHYAAAER